MSEPRPFRIRADQSEPTKATQALMILSNELNLAVYRQPYELGNTAQREALLHTVNTEFNVTFDLPKSDDRSVRYLLDADGVPVLLPIDVVLPWVVGYALAKGGLDAARRVSYRADMLPKE